MTITDLARKVGMNRVNLSVSIKGNPTLSTLEKIASALNISISELFVSNTDTAPNSDTKIVCPHCGKQITIKTEI